MYLGILLQVCLCTTHAHGECVVHHAYGATGGQKRTSEPLRLEL